MQYSKIHQQINVVINEKKTQQIYRKNLHALFAKRSLFNGFVTSCWVGLKFNPSIDYRMSMPFRDGHRSSIRNSAQIVAEKVANWLFIDGGAKFMLKRWQNLRGNCQKNVIVSAVNRDNISDTAKQICTRQICIFFRFSEVIRQFVWFILF